MRIITYILICILILLIYILCRYHKYEFKEYTCKDSNIYKKILYSNIKDHIKTGDLLLYSHNYADLDTRVFGDRKFSHIGIAVKIDNKLYSYDIEGHDLVINGKIYFKKGINLTPLSKRIKMYDGDTYIARLKQKLNEDQLNMFKQFILTTHYKYMSEYKIFLSYLFSSNKLLNNERFCNEFVAEILDNLNISNIPIKSAKEFISLEILKLTNNDIYLNPVHIIHDELLINNIKNNKLLTLC
jgi:hypothetical protein